MARKKAQNTYYSEYKRERDKLKRRMRDMQKRGFEFSSMNIPKRPKKITQKSVERLRRLNLQYLYEHSTYSGLATNKRVSGLRGRQLERMVAGLRGSATKRKKRAIQTQDENWTNQQANRDTENIERLKQQTFEDMFNASKILEQNTWQILLDRESEFPTQVNEIRLLLMKAETDDPSFWSRLADEHPEFLDELDKALYKGRGSQSIAPRAFNNIRSAILDRPLTLQETKVSMDIYDIDRSREYEPSQDYQDLSSVPFNPNE